MAEVLYFVIRRCRTVLPPTTRVRVMTLFSVKKKTVLNIPGWIFVSFFSAQGSLEPSLLNLILILSLHWVLPDFKFFHRLISDIMGNLKWYPVPIYLTLKSYPPDFAVKIKINIILNFFCFNYVGPLTKYSNILNFMTIDFIVTERIKCDRQTGGWRKSYHGGSVFTILARDPIKNKSLGKRYASSIKSLFSIK